MKVEAMDREEIAKFFEGAKLYAVVHVDKDGAVFTTAAEGTPIKDLVRLLRHAARDLASGHVIQKTLGRPG
jgi:hypothetical protein